MNRTIDLPVLPLPAYLLRGVNLLCIIAAVFVPVHARTVDTLTILAEDDAAPWSYPDGSGCANEIVVAAFAAAGVEVNLKPVPYARGKKAVLEGMSVGCFSMAPEPELGGNVLFPKMPLFICSTSFLQKSGSLLTIDSLRARAASADTVMVGIVFGYEYPPLLKNLQKEGLIRIEESRSELINLKKLDADRIDLALTNHNQFKSWNAMCKEANVRHPVSAAFDCGEMKLYIGFSSRHPRSAWALQVFEEGYEEAAKKGTLQLIMDNWSGKVK